MSEHKKNDDQEREISRKVERYHEAYKVLDDLSKNFPKDLTRDELEVLDYRVAEQENSILEVANNLSQWSKLKKKIQLPEQGQAADMIQLTQTMKKRIIQLKNEFNELFSKEPGLSRSIKLSELKQSMIQGTSKDFNLEENFTTPISAYPTMGQTYRKTMMSPKLKTQILPKPIYTHSTPFGTFSGGNFETAQNITPVTNNDLAQLKEQMSQLTNLVQ